MRRKKRPTYRLIALMAAGIIGLSLLMWTILMIRFSDATTDNKPTTTTTTTPTTRVRHTFTVATYNAWNSMFNWNLRLRWIAGMIRRRGVDVVAFQELRNDTGPAAAASFGRSAFSVLRGLLPEHRWTGYVAEESTGEGVALFSRFPIVNQSSARLALLVQGNDPTPRVALGALADIPFFGKVSFIVTHWSTDRQTQCANAAELRLLVEGAQPQSIVALGDFNVYPGFPFPIDLLETGRPQGKCSGALEQANSDRPGASVQLEDAWHVLEEPRPNANGGATKFGTDEDTAGLTFSNMPFPGLTGRPDRVLFRGIRPVQAEVVGDGTEYRAEYGLYIKLWRAFVVLFGIGSETTCAVCGPHALCQCGICMRPEYVAGVQRCGPSFGFFMLAAMSIASFVCAACWLAVHLGSTPRRSFARHSHRWWLWWVTLVAFAVLVPGMLAYVSERSAIASAFNPIKEELFPSDHRAVIVTFTEQD